MQKCYTSYILLFRITAPQHLEVIIFIVVMRHFVIILRLFVTSAPLCNFCATL